MASIKLGHHLKITMAFELHKWLHKMGNHFKELHWPSKADIKIIDKMANLKLHFSELRLEKYL